MARVVNLIEMLYVTALNGESQQHEVLHSSVIIPQYTSVLIQWEFLMKMQHTECYLYNAGKINSVRVGLEAEIVEG